MPKYDEYFADYEEVPYRSVNKKKRTKKSNHKHVYEDVILFYRNAKVEKYEPRFYKGRECIICGKTDLTNWSFGDSLGLWRRDITVEEVQMAYPDMRIVEVDSIW